MMPVVVPVTAVAGNANEQEKKRKKEELAKKAEE